MTADRGTQGGTDGGFTLVEVIAALVVLAMVATAAAYFFISGTRTSSHLQRTQNAVAVANEAMEMAFAVEPRDSVVVANTPTIVLGREKTDVEAAWAAAAALGIDGLSDTYPVWDATATAASTPVLPITLDRRYSGQDYDVTILVGSCIRPANVTGSDETCTRLAGFSSDPGDAGTPSTMVRMLRVIAIVTWDSSIGECATDQCSYQLSGLMDRNADIEWNRNVVPVAIDDFGSIDRTMPGSNPVVINVLENDIIGSVISNPIIDLTAPPVGTATKSADGMVTYTAPAWGSGIYTFTYRIVDAQGQQSDPAAPAVISVTVPPLSANDTANVYAGIPAAVSPTTNDNGTPGTLEIVSGPAHGTATVSGLNIVYTAGIASGLDGVTYRYTDTSGQVSPNATVTFNISTLPTSDKVIDVPARNAGADVWTSLDETILAGVPSPGDFRINIVGARPTAGSLRVGNAPNTGNLTATTGTNVDYSPPASTIGEYTFQYSLTHASGWTSSARTVTLRVIPVATADTFSTSFRRGAVRDIGIGGNDAPSTYLGSTNVTVQLGAIVGGSRCGVWPTGTFPANQPKLTSGIVQVNMTNATASGNNCTFTYTLVGTGTLSGLRSATVTVTYKVSN